MSRTLPTVEARRIQVIELLSGDGLAIEDLIAQLRPRPSLRTIMADMTWLRMSFPEHLQRTRASSRHFIHRWTGPIPLLLASAITWLFEDELIGLVAARGLLRDPTPQAKRRGGTEHAGMLAMAIQRLLDRSGTRGVVDILQARCYHQPLRRRHAGSKRPRRLSRRHRGG